MKSIFSSKITLFCTALLASIFIVMACGKIEDLTKDVELKVDGDIIRIPVSLQFIDPNAAGAGDEMDIEVKFTGADANKLYSTVATKEFLVGGGVVDIAVKKTDAPDPKTGKKLEFTVIASSKSGKYLRTIRNISVSDTNTAFVTIPMVNLSAPPVGVSVQKTTVTTDANGTTAAKTITNTNTEKLEVTIPAGTKMYAADGTELKGTVNVQVVHFSPTSLASLESFPGGFSVNKAVDINGTAIGAGSFTTAGFMAIDMSVGDKEVKTFSGNGITLKSDISPSIIKEDNTKIQVGDQIPVWSLNETDGSWIRETTTTVAGTATNMTVTYAQKHLSMWNLDLFAGNCGGGRVVIPSNVVPAFYYVEIVRVGGGSTLPSTWGGSTTKRLSLRPGDVLSFNMGTQGGFYLKLYNGTNPLCPGDWLYESSQISLCGSTSTPATFSAKGTIPSTVTVNIFVSGYCASTPNLALNPNITIYFKKAGCPYWAALGAMTGGFIASSGTLGVRQSYDFMAVLNGIPTVFPSKTVPAEFGTGGAVTIVLPKIAVPKTYCSQIF
jgi:hypothetical protein